MATSGRIPVGGRAVYHQIIYSEEEGHHCGAHFQLSHIWTIHGGRKCVGIRRFMRWYDQDVGR